MKAQSSNYSYSSSFLLCEGMQNANFLNNPELLFAKGYNSLTGCLFSWQVVKSHPVFVRHDTTCWSSCATIGRTPTWGENTSLTCRKRTRLCRLRIAVAGAHTRWHINGDRRLHLSASCTTACSLACAQMMMVSTRNGLMLRGGCDKAARRRRCCSMCSSLLGYALF